MAGKGGGRRRNKAGNIGKCRASKVLTQKGKEEKSGPGEKSACEGSTRRFRPELSTGAKGTRCSRGTSLHYRDGGDQGLKRKRRQQKRGRLSVKEAKKRPR